MTTRILSKSKYLLGLQCPRCLWISLNQKELVPAPDIGTQYLFDQGHRVGELAKKLVPGGIDMVTDNFMENIRLTRELLLKRQPRLQSQIAIEAKLTHKVHLIECNF